MGWIFKMMVKASKVDMTDVMNQQTAGDIISIVKELLL